MKLEMEHDSFIALRAENYGDKLYLASFWNDAKCFGDEKLSDIYHHDHLELMLDYDQFGKKHRRNLIGGGDEVFHLYERSCKENPKDEEWFADDIESMLIWSKVEIIN